jgi:ABC-2 type transport system ATP-binding protein
MRAPIILATNLTRRFGPTLALDRVNLAVAPGEIVGLVGVNGAGKTTLLEILATLLLPSDGTASVAGFDVVADARRVRQRIGYAPADAHSFYQRLTGTANLLFFAAAAGFTPPDARARVAAVRSLVGLDGAADVRFDRYSEGMMSRLSLARALLTDAPALLLDEPTRSLDPLCQREMRRFLRRTAADALDKAVLLVTHSLAEASEICDRVVVLAAGRVVMDAPTVALAARGGAGGLEAVLAELAAAGAA